MKSIGRAKGWRAKDLNAFTNENRTRSKEHDRFFVKDLEYVEAYIVAHENGKHNRNEAARNRSNRFKKKKVMSDAVSIKYLCNA